MTAYITTRRVEATAAQLTDQDWQLLNHLATVKLLTGNQLYRLLDATSITAKRLVRRQLSGLRRRQIVTTLDRRVGGVRAGSDSHVYALDILGQRLVSNDDSIRFRRPWTPTVRILRHLLAVSELYVRLVEADRDGQLELLSFDTEPACWRSFVGPGGARMILKPDADLVMGVGDWEHHAWIEMDMGTESLPWITEKAKTYGRYYATGREQERVDVFPRCLWIAPSPVRGHGLVDALSRLPADQWLLHQATTNENAIEALLTRAQHHVNGELQP